MARNLKIRVHIHQTGDITHLLGGSRGTNIENAAAPSKFWWPWVTGPSHISQTGINQTTEFLQKAREELCREKPWLEPGPLTLKSWWPCQIFTGPCYPYDKERSTLRTHKHFLAFTIVYNII